MYSVASEKRIRVAIVGSGLAGLTVAYLLAHDSEKRYEVEIFEAVSNQFISPRHLAAQPNLDFMA